MYEWTLSLPLEHRGAEQQRIPTSSGARSKNKSLCQAAEHLTSALESPSPLIHSKQMWRTCRLKRCPKAMRGMLFRVPSHKSTRGSCAHLHSMNQKLASIMFILSGFLSIFTRFYINFYTGGESISSIIEKTFSLNCFYLLCGQWLVYMFYSAFDMFAKKYIMDY